MRNYVLRNWQPLRITQYAVELGLAKRQARVILSDLVSATGKDLP